MTTRLDKFLDDVRAGRLDDDAILRHYDSDPEIRAALDAEMARNDYRDTHPEPTPSPGPTPSPTPSPSTHLDTHDCDSSGQCRRFDDHDPSPRKDLPMSSHAPSRKELDSLAARADAAKADFEHRNATAAQRPIGVAAPPTRAQARFDGALEQDLAALPSTGDPELDAKRRMQARNAARSRRPLGGPGGNNGGGEAA